MERFLGDGFLLVRYSSNTFCKKDQFAVVRTKPKTLGSCRTCSPFESPFVANILWTVIWNVTIWDADAFGGVATRQSNSVSRDDDFNIPQAWSPIWGSCICLSCLCQYAWKKIIESFKGCEVLGWICDLHSSRLQKKKHPPAAILISGVLVCFMFLCECGPSKVKVTLSRTGFPEFLYCLVLKHGRGGGWLRLWYHGMEHDDGTVKRCPDWDFMEQRTLSREKVWGDGS